MNRTSATVNNHISAATAGYKGALRLSSTQVTEVLKPACISTEGENGLKPEIFPMKNVL